jgi:hypothetical protein
MMVKLFNTHSFSLMAISIAFFVFSCKKDQEYVPYVPVNFTLDLNIINELTSTGYSKLYPYEGYGGVIVFCQFYDVVTPTASVYYAFDATCTYEISDTCSVVNEGNNVKAVCPCCESEYYLYGGYPYKGEATVSLKMYNVSILNNRLRIYN